MADLITFSSSAVPRAARVVGFRGAEAISRPYEHEIFLALHGEEIELASAIGAAGRLTIDREKDTIPPFIFAGIVAHIELLHDIDGLSLVRVILVPRLWRLGLSRHSRIFTKVKLPDVIKAVLEDNGLTGNAYELRLGGYEVEEHVCQYRESDLDFLSRWMEREGIYYFFEHTDDGERLIVCDDRSYPADPMGAPVRYRPQLGGDLRSGASFRTFSCRHSTLPALVKLKDYDYARPNLALSGVAPVAPNGAGEVSLYGERFFTPSAGERLARLRAEELNAREVVAQATGGRLHLRPGYTFELDEHPRAPLNARYLTIDARYYGNQSAGHDHFRELIGLEHDDVYLVDLRAIPAKTQLRPESRTPWPRIYGYESGNVDGAADSDYAQIDDHGSYSVKFKFDESDLALGKASTWVRMVQPHGGDVEGFHFPLRKGTEVVISFLGGDPDRPVISGVVPNALTPSPVTTGNHTKNVIQTGGRNRLELEDEGGQQRITLSTPYSNTFLRMGSPEDGKELAACTDDNMLINAKKALDVRAGESGAGYLTTIVQDDVTTRVRAGSMYTTLDVGDMATTLFKGNMTTTVATGKLETWVTGLVKEVYFDKYTTDVTLERDLTVDGKHTIKSNLGYSHDVKAGHTLHVVDGGRHETVDDGGWTSMVQKGGIEITSNDGDITIKAPSNNIVITSVNSTVTSTGTTTEQHFGDWVKFDFSAGLEFTLAAKASFTFGRTFSLFAGVQDSVTLGNQNSLTIGSAIGVSLANKIDISVGVSVAVNAAISLSLAPTRIDTANTQLKAAATALHLHGFTVL
jgi:type VI secretion system secreted protein VgrG